MWKFQFLEWLSANVKLLGQRRINHIWTHQLKLTWRTLSSFTTPTLPENRQPQSKAISTLHVRFSCINVVKQLGRRGSSCLTSLECDYVTIQPHQHCQCYSYDSPSITYGLVQKTKLTTVLPTAKAKGKHQNRKIHQHQVTEKLYVYEEESFVIVFNGKWLDIFVPECCFEVGFTCPKL